MKVLLLALVLALAPAFGYAQAFDLESYASLLADVEASLGAASHAQPDEQARIAAAGAQRLQAVTSVEVGGASVQPRHPALLRALESDPPDLAAAQAALGALRRAVDASPGMPPTEHQLNNLKAVLDRPEFQTTGFGALEPILGPFVTAARRLLFDGLAAAGQLLLEQGRMGVVVAGGLAVGVVAAAAFFVWRSLRGSLVADVRSGANRPRGEATRSGAFWREGQRAAAQGEARMAIHAYFLAAALYLDELGLLPFDPSQTNREHLARLGREDLRPLLEPLVASYDALWYSHAPCGSTEVEHVQRLAGQVRSVTP